MEDFIKLVGAANKHEYKQKVNGAVKRYKRALEGHCREKEIRNRIMELLAEGVNCVQAFNLGIEMCKRENGNEVLNGIDLDGKIFQMKVEWSKD